MVGLTSRALAAAGLTGLVVLGGAYIATREPAPTVRVRWRDSVSASRQAELERAYALRDPRSPNPDAPRSLAYSLLDTSASNVEAIVRDADVADTSDIDRRAFTVRADAQPSPQTTWIAYRIPGLRDAAVQWGLVVLFALAFAAGIARDAGRAVRRVARVSVQAAPLAIAAASDARKEAGRLWTLACAPITIAQGPPIITKVMATALVVVALGVPLVETWKAAALAVALLAIIFSVPRAGVGRIAAAVAMAAAAGGITLVLPHADLAEAHNAFLVAGPGEALERGLPPPIFASWKAQFDALYPAAAEPEGSYTWRAERVVPTALFTRSSDALWRRAKYTRQVDDIGFTTLAEFRAGFANELPYNFWTGQVRREEMPFYVMYELTPASVGSRFAWQGQAFWQRADGSFEEVVHPKLAERRIEPQDAGRRIYAAFFPARDGGREFALHRSATLRASALLAAVVSLACAAAIVLLMFAVRWDAYLRAAGICALAALLLASNLGGRAEFNGALYRPHSGGDDGLLHDGHGRAMAMLVREGRVAKALEGFEPTYWFTPGTRYVRMVEKLIFGDTNQLFWLQLVTFPLVVFYLIGHLLGMRWAALLTAVFCLLPVGNFSWLQYVVYARAGYGEGVGAALFLLGLALMLRTQPRWGGVRGRMSHIWVAGAALAASMFIRPNFAIAVVWLGAAYAWASFRTRDWRSITAVGLGLACALWMPLHNWVYGHELYLISRSGGTVSIPLGVRDYAAAAASVARGETDTNAARMIAGQLGGWLSGPGFVGANAYWLAWVLWALKLFGLGLCAVLALKWVAGRLRGQEALGVIAVAALCAHVPMLMVFNPSFRYAVLGWDLSLIALIVWAAQTEAVSSRVQRAALSPA